MNTRKGKCQEELRTPRQRETGEHGQGYMGDEEQSCADDFIMEGDWGMGAVGVLRGHDKGVWKMVSTESKK